MNRETGSAVVVVLLILGVLSLLGAGLMVQTRYDTKFNRAQGSHDKMVNLADGATRVAFYGVSYQSPGAYEGEASKVVIDSQTKSTVGLWEANAWFLGASMNPQDVAGWEIGTGFHMQYWVAQGSGSKSDLGYESALSTVQIAGIKFTK